jgi:sugar/nucleoside kinase (ribokinase family)
MKICSIGGITQDIFLWYLVPEQAHLDRALCLNIPYGEKIDLQKVSYFLGGGAANTAVSFKRLGCEPTLIANCGDDQPGDFIHEELTRQGVSTDSLQQHPTEPSGTSYILHNQQHDRVIFVNRGANQAMTTASFPLDDCAGNDYLYITSMRHKNDDLLGTITRYAHQNKISVAINPGSTQLSDGALELCAALHAVTILMLNRSEALTLMRALIAQNREYKQQLVSEPKQAVVCGKPSETLFYQPLACGEDFVTLHAFFTLMLNIGPRVVVVTDGACGVYVATPDALLFHQAIPVEVVDTVGAGDAFGSAFVATFAQTQNPETALQAGMVNSTSVIQHLGAQAGLLMADELKKRTATLDSNLLSKYSW